MDAFSFSRQEPEVAPKGHLHASVLSACHPRRLCLADADNFYPVEVSFSSNKTFCDIAVEAVQHTQRDGPVKYSYRKALNTADYVVS